MLFNHTDNIFVSALIVAAGKSSRMNMDINKQFICLDDMPIIAHTVRVFQNTPIINEIIIVANKNDIDFVKDNIVLKYSFNKVTQVVIGGSERQSSVYNGIINANPQAEIIAIHDGARPFITSDIITSTVFAAIENGSSVCAVKVKDTIKTSSDSGFIEQTLDRNCLWSIQTPQTFRSAIIRKAHEDAISSNFLGTDDAVLVERTGIKTKIVPGSYYNLKITTQEDLTFARAIIQR